MLAHILSLPVALYIRRQHDRLTGQSHAISDAARLRMAPYFSADLLSGVRIVERDPLPIPNPPFANSIRRLGFDYPNLALTAAITFGNLIATRAPMSPSLLFHELVHVVQYQRLGISVFARQYVHGLLTYRSYEQIPLEAAAFQLQARFEWERVPFDVEAELARQMGHNPNSS